MDQAQYLILMAGCLLITLPLELVIGARVYRRPKRLLVALVPMLVVFVAWDLLGIVRDHWTYNPRFVTGTNFGILPLEELTFFIVIPICGLLTYEAVGKILELARGTGRVRFRWPDGLVRESGEEQTDG
ncbi:MAG: lycopene cyclase [Propionibacteriales bacterium]|nr:MAG: lycopene cyclase [Propionibacteriales bacterium]